MLFSHPSAWNTCLHILRQRGYDLFLLGDPDEHGSISRCSWNAEKDGMRFRGENPIELLGLTAIYEHHRPLQESPYWWRIDGTDMVAELESAWRNPIAP
jgi:hypothetical protein